MKRIAIFASGGGSNARQILAYFQDRTDVSVVLIVTNRKTAGVLQHAAEFGVPTLTIDRDYFYQSEAIVEALTDSQIDLIALAGFLWLIPSYLVEAYPRAIVNIHPALLPKYGGKGMYGKHVHEAVVAAGEQETGITVHFVNEHYDEGKHIFQASCPVSPDDSAQAVAANVLALEHQHFARVLDEILTARQ